MEKDRMSDAFRRQFAHYEAPYDLGAWEAFDRARRPRRRLGGWWLRAAASILLLLVSTVTTDHWPAGNRDKVKQLTARSVRQNKNRQDQLSPSSVGAVANAGAHRREREKVSASDSLLSDLARRSRRIASQYPRTIKSEKPALPQNGAFIAQRKADDQSLESEDIFPASGNERQETASVGADSGDKLLGPLPEIEQISARSVRPTGIALSMNEPTYPSEQVAEVSRSSAKARRSVRVGGSLLPQSSYIQANQPSLALGGGISAEIFLSKRLALVSGLTVARQRLQEESGKAAVLEQIGVPKLTGTRYAWWNVDVPINLRYQFGGSPTRNWFVTAGVSSVGTLGQTFERTYRTNQIVTTTVILMSGQTEEIQRIVPTSETLAGESPDRTKFEAARFLNASVGVDCRIGGRQWVIVEPYFKYPLTHISPEKLKYATLGLQLRWLIGINKTP